MGSGIVFDILATLVLLLFLGAKLDKDRHRSRLLLLIAMALLAGGLIAWCLQALPAVELP
jgi:uncharacterized membrane protein